MKKWIELLKAKKDRQIKQTLTICELYVACEIHSSLDGDKGELLQKHKDEVVETQNRIKRRFPQTHAEWKREFAKRLS